MKVNSGQAASTLIPEYIGSAFDKIVTVADNIKQIKDIAASIEGVVGSGYIGDTPPTEPSAGATWYCTTDGRSYIWYEDADSGQWVESSPQNEAKEATGAAASAVAAHKAEQNAHEIADITGLTEALASIGNGSGGGSGGGFGGQYKNLTIIVSKTGYKGTITADRIVVESSDYKTSVIHGLNISFDGAMAGAGGLDTGSIAENTWYYIYVVYNPISKTSVALLSTSATAPTLPTGYTQLARVGAAYSLSGTFRASTQNNNIVIFSLDNSEISSVQVLNKGSATDPTPFYLNSAVPEIAKSAFININSSGTALLLVTASPDYVFSTSNGGWFSANTIDYPLLFGRVAYYRVTSGGEMNNYVVGYKI